MLKAAKYFLILFAAIFFLTTCKKYPEDTFISFRTVKMRLEGEWQLERIEINDENVGYKYSDSLSPITFKDFKFWFKFGVGANNVPGSKAKADLLMINKSSKSEADALKNPDVSGLDFSLNLKKKEIIIGGTSTEKTFSINDSVAYMIFTNLLITNLWVDRGWEIRTLYSKKLIIERTKKNNIKYKLHLKKIRNK